MVVYLCYTKTDKNNIMKNIKTYIEKEVKLLNTQSGGGRELTHFGKGAKHAFLKVLDKIKELESVNNIDVVEPELLEVK